MLHLLMPSYALWLCPPKACFAVCVSTPVSARFRHLAPQFAVSRIFIPKHCKSQEGCTASSLCGSGQMLLSRCCSPDASISSHLDYWLIAAAGQQGALSIKLSGTSVSFEMLNTILDVQSLSAQAILQERGRMHAKCWVPMGLRCPLAACCCAAARSLLPGPHRQPSAQHGLSQTCFSAAPLRCGHLEVHMRNVQTSICYSFGSTSA